MSDDLGIPKNVFLSEFLTDFIRKKLIRKGKESRRAFK